MDSPEYKALQAQNEQLADKYELAASKSKGELIEQVSALKQRNEQVSAKNSSLITQVKSLEKSKTDALTKLHAEQVKLRKTTKAFNYYLTSNQRTELAKKYMQSMGWEEVSLSTVQRLESDYSSKEVVYVQFDTGLGTYSGWYELGYMASSYNMPHVSFAKGGLYDVTVIGSDGTELSLDECNDCKSQ